MHFINPKNHAALAAACLLIAALGSGLAKAEEKAAEGAAKDGAAETPKDQREYMEKTSKLSTLSNRIEDGDKKFQELVRQKAESHSTEEKQACIKEMVEITNQRNKDVEAYMKIKSDLSLRYPQQGEKLNRRYQTQSKRSLEEMEAAGGLDELLTRTKKIVERKFAPFNPESEKPAAKAKVAMPDDEKPKRLKLEK